MPNEERNKRKINQKFKCIQILQNQEGEAVEETFYKEGYEYPIDKNLMRDSEYKKHYERKERQLKNSDGLTPQRRKEIDMDLLAGYHCEVLYFELEIEKEKTRDLEEDLYKYRKLYGPL